MFRGGGRRRWAPPRGMARRSAPTPGRWVRRRGHPRRALCGARRRRSAGSRVLWSCVNALKLDLTGLAVGFDDSAAEQVARHGPGARVVAAIPPFASAIAPSSLAYDAGLAPTVFLCAEDPATKETVAGLVRDLGGAPRRRWCADGGAVRRAGDDASHQPLLRRRAARSRVAAAGAVKPPPASRGHAAQITHWAAIDTYQPA
jgi:hypothetical protein